LGASSEFLGKEVAPMVGRFLMDVLAAVVAGVLVVLISGYFLRK
jgi:hypothetical protein